MKALLFFVLMFVLSSPARVYAMGKQPEGVPAAAPAAAKQEEKAKPAIVTPADKARVAGEAEARRKKVEAQLKAERKIMDKNRAIVQSGEQNRQRVKSFRERMKKPVVIPSKTAVSPSSSSAPADAGQAKAAG